MSLWFELALAAYCAAAGFAASGIVSSLYECVTGDRARFHFADETVLKGVGSLLFAAFSGPAIVMRNALRARLVEGRPVGWLVASTVLSVLWSLCSGIIVLNITLALV